MRSPRTLWALAALLAAAGGAQPLQSPLHDDDIPRILAHGPWPPPPLRDVSNRVSGQPAAIAFGATLFHEPRLSRDGQRACASCHQPARGFSDGLPRAQGLQPGTLEGRLMLNLDTEDWGEFYLGCAGGVDVNVSRPGTPTPRSRRPAPA